MLMDRILPLSVISRQPLSVTELTYRYRMESQSKKTMRANVLALLGRVKPLRSDETGVSRLLQAGLSNGNAQRVLAADQDIYMTRLDEVARALRVEPWQLLVPGIDPDRPPLLTAPPAVSEKAMEIAAIFDDLDDHGRRVLRATAHSLILPEVPPPRPEPVLPPPPTVRPASVTKKPVA